VVDGIRQSPAVAAESWVHPSQFARIRFPSRMSRGPISARNRGARGLPPLASHARGRWFEPSRAHEKLHVSERPLLRPHYQEVDGSHASDGLLAQPPKPSPRGLAGRLALRRDGRQSSVRVPGPHQRARGPRPRRADAMVVARAGTRRRWPGSDPTPKCNRPSPSSGVSSRRRHKRTGGECR
jgi:hypothetical protein